MSLMSHPIKIARLLTIYMIFMSNVNILATNMDIVLIYSNTIDIICIIIKKSQYLSRDLKNTFFMRTNKTNKKNNKPSMNICAKQHAIM